MPRAAALAAVVFWSLSLVFVLAALRVLNVPVLDEALRAVTGYVPHLGSIFEKLPVVLQIIRSTFATAGCRSIDELHEKAVLEMQSPSALRDSDVHDMVAANIDRQIL